MEISKTFIYASLILWQIGFIVGILLKLFYNPSGKKIVSTVVSNTPAVEVETPKSKPSHIDVEMKNIKLMGIVQELAPVREREQSVNKFEVIEAVKNYQMIGGKLFKDNGIIEVAKQLVSIAESAQNHVLSETDDWFDAVSVKRNMKELKGLTGQFKKAALEANAVNERLSALYEDMGHILNRYYDIDEAMDPVGKEDGDIDNDGDTDDSDRYLKKRRAAIAKAIKKQKNGAG